MKHFFLFLFTVISTVAIAQSGSAKQVTWTSSAKKLSEGVYEVKLVADIKGDYHMYAQAAGIEGPVPTAFSFTPNPLVTLNGKVKEVGKMVKKYESAWEGNVNYYEKKVEFVQQVKLKGKAKTNLAGKVEFMVCNESQCLPPSEVDFKVAVGG
jgi:DsbC/DsbD-like thiol-disulfide interchange protein